MKELSGKLLMAMQYTNCSTPESTRNAMKASRRRRRAGVCARYERCSVTSGEDAAASRALLLLPAEATTGGAGPLAVRFGGMVVGVRRGETAVRRRLGARAVR